MLGDLSTRLPPASSISEFPGARFLTASGHGPVKDPVGKHPQKFRDNSHLPRNRAVGDAGVDRFHRAAREFICVQNEGHLVGIFGGEGRTNEPRGDRRDVDPVFPDVVAEAFKVADDGGFT